MAKKKLTGRAYLLEQHRQERLLKDREAIRVLRQHFTGYTAQEGFSLDPRKIAQMPYHRRRALRKKYTKVATLLAQPHDLIPAKNVEKAKVLRRFTHERMRHLKHFIVQKPSKESYVKIRKGFVELHTKFPGQVEAVGGYFLFPRRAKGPGDMEKMLKAMLPNMPKGHYELLTDTYGGTGAIVDRGKVMRRLQTYLADYDDPKYGEHRFLNRVLGFRWMSTTVEGAEVQQAARDEHRARQRELNRKYREQLAREAEARARRESGK